MSQKLTFENLILYILYVLDTLMSKTVETTWGCRNLCQTTEGCIGFVFENDLKLCQLKDVDVILSVQKEGVISGILPCP